MDAHFFEKILTTTRAEEKSRDQYLAHCPAHPDQNPSLSLSLKDNKILLKCHAGCSYESIAGALKNLGTWPTEKSSVTYIKKENKLSKDSKEGKKVSGRFEYFYEDLGGTPHLKIARTEFSDHTKTFRQYHFKDNAWIAGGAENSIRPYNYSKWQDGRVYLVEGEKKCQRLISEGVNATCFPGGANAWRAEYGPFFKDREVILLPDNDEPGWSFIQKSGVDISKYTNDVFIFPLPDLAIKEDVFDCNPCVIRVIDGCFARG